jgi:hypothetical protein
MYAISARDGLSKCYCTIFLCNFFLLSTLFFAPILFSLLLTTILLVVHLSKRWFEQMLLHYLYAMHFRNAAQANDSLRQCY